MEAPMENGRCVRTRFLALAVFLFSVLTLAHGTSRADTLVFFEASVGPGTPYAIASPASDERLDINYSPLSAEGAGLYGFSEVLIVTTGDLSLTTSGFSCQTFGCLWSPNPFVGGSSILVSGADNLTGEFSGSQDLLTISVSGTLGYVALIRGEYLDATGLAQNIGTIQTLSAVILASVPEPGLGIAIATGCLCLAGRSRRSKRPRPAAPPL